MSPAPFGQKPRPRKFLLRMTVEEDAFVRARAEDWEVPLNGAICLIIDEAAAHHRYAALTKDKQGKPKPEQQPEPEPALEPKPAAKKRGSRRPLKSPAASEIDDIPGQTSITDTDQ